MITKHEVNLWACVLCAGAFAVLAICCGVRWACLHGYVYHLLGAVGVALAIRWLGRVVLHWDDMSENEIDKINGRG